MAAAASALAIHLHEGPELLPSRGSSSSCATWRSQRVRWLAARRSPVLAFLSPSSSVGTASCARGSSLVPAFSSSMRRTRSDVLVLACLAHWCSWAQAAHPKHLRAGVLEPKAAHPSVRSMLAVARPKRRSWAQSSSPETASYARSGSPVPAFLSPKQPTRVGVVCSQGAPAATAGARIGESARDGENARDGESTRNGAPAAPTGAHIGKSACNGCPSRQER